MIEKFNTLLRVKILKEERLFRDLQVKRWQVAEAAEAARHAERIVKESEETLPEREEAIYRKVYGKVVNLPGIDDLKNEVADLEKVHQRLRDKMDRAVHVLDRLEDELASAKLNYEQAARKRDKYSIMDRQPRK